MKSKKINIPYLKKELEVKNLLIGELLKIITTARVKMPVELLKIINDLYAGKKDGREENKRP